MDTSRRRTTRSRVGRPTDRCLVVGLWELSRPTFCGYTLRSGLWVLRTLREDVVLPAFTPDGPGDTTVADGSPPSPRQTTGWSGSSVLGPWYVETLSHRNSLEGGGGTKDLRIGRGRETRNRRGREVLVLRTKGKTLVQKDRKSRSGGSRDFGPGGTMERTGYVGKVGVWGNRDLFLSLRRPTLGRQDPEAHLDTATTRSWVVSLSTRD